MRVLLINPPVKWVFEPWYDTPDFVRTGLAYVAGYLRQHADCEIAIIDSKFERLDFEQTLERVKRFDPDVVGLTAFTNEIKPAALMAGMIKEWKPEACTVIGGVHVTALPKETLDEFPEFDLAVFGEGEVTFAELIRALSAAPLSTPDSSRLTPIDGLAFRENETVRVNAPRTRVIDLDEIPFPAWDLLPSARTYFLQVSRGCPFACKFCMNPNGKIARRRSIANVIEELESVIDAHEPAEIWYGDEIFTVDVEFTKRLLRKKIERGIPESIKWSAVTHVRFLDAELLELMSASNVALIGLGIETGDEETLKRIGKGTTIEMISKARAQAKEHNVPITTYMIFGQPNETRASIKKSIDLAVKLNPELPIFGIMVPYPGTEVSRLAARGEAGYRLLTQDWDAYNKQIGGALEFAALSRSQIEMLQIWAYIKVFLWNLRLKDLAAFIWEYRTAGLAVVRKIATSLLRNLFAGRRERETSAPDRIHAPDNGHIEQAAKAWHDWQVSELVRTKTQNPGQYRYREKLKRS